MKGAAMAALCGNLIASILFVSYGDPGVWMPLLGTALSLVVLFTPERRDRVSDEL